MNRFVKVKILQFQSCTFSCVHTQSNTVAGSTLLATVESLALNVLPPDSNIITQNIGTVLALVYCLLCYQTQSSVGSTFLMGGHYVPITQLIEGHIKVVFLHYIDLAIGQTFPLHNYMNID